MEIEKIVLQYMSKKSLLTREKIEDIVEELKELDLIDKNFDGMSIYKIVSNINEILRDKNCGSLKVRLCLENGIKQCIKRSDDFSLSSEFLIVNNELDLIFDKVDLKHSDVCCGKSNKEIAIDVRKVAAFFTNDILEGYLNYISTSKNCEIDEYISKHFSEEDLEKLLLIEKIYLNALRQSLLFMKGIKSSSDVVEISNYKTGSSYHNYLTLMNEEKLSQVCCGDFKLKLDTVISSDDVVFYVNNKVVTENQSGMLEKRYKLVQDMIQLKW